MIGAVLRNDKKVFKQAVSLPTHWEHEALSSLAAEAIAELAEHTNETPQAILARLVTTFSGAP